jgi:cyanophycin synthetase
MLGEIEVVSHAHMDRRMQEKDMDLKDIEKLRANQRFVVRELLHRGIEVTVLDWTSEVLEARFGDHSELLIDIIGTNLPYAGTIAASSKAVTKLLLQRAGISAPKGDRFFTEEREAIEGYARTIGFPLVVKPTNGTQGDSVYVGIESVEELAYAVDRIWNELGCVEILVEEEFSAPEYRLFINRYGDYAVAHRDPAHVVGDGIHTLKQLAEQETFRRMNPRKNCLCPVVLDEETERFLKKEGRTTEFIPKRNEKAYLRAASNLMKGGTCTDVTDTVHASWVGLGLLILSLFPGLPYAGIDVLATEIQAPLSPDGYRVLEVNSLPGIGMHIAPSAGKPRNVAAFVVDTLFPETRIAQSFHPCAAAYEH